MSQLIASPSQKKIEEYKWKRIGKFDSLSIETFFRNDSYRSVQKSGRQKRVCKECIPNIDKHLVVVWYRRCSSVKCNEEEDVESCPYRFKCLIIDLIIYNRN